MITLQAAHEVEQQLIAWRREFHMHPELGFQEIQTAGRVAEELAGLGYRLRTGVGRTGVVGEKGQGEPIIALRFDMDALPIQESNQVPYASQVAGIMHACGHDAHTAIGLGVATLLAREDFSGTVRLIFQPAEELEDEQGLSGASRMAQEGVMQGVSNVLALHVASSLAVGDIAIEEGPASAGVDTFYGKVIGLGGHGARPHETMDPIYLAGHVILAIHGIVSRRLDPFAPAVITIGSIHGGQTDNVIPDDVQLIGTIRYRDIAVQERIHLELEKAFGVARQLGGDYTLRIVQGCPSVVNDARVVGLIREVADELLGEGHMKEPEQSMGAEDFSVFCEAAPGAMFRLGCRIEGDERLAHNPYFDIDEACLPIGVAILAEAAKRLLSPVRAY
jgi:amidohydrolase